MSRHQLSMIAELAQYLTGRRLEIENEIKNEIEDEVEDRRQSLELLYSSEEEDASIPRLASNMIDSSSTKYRRIGKGACGSVWASEPGRVAVKREDGDTMRSLLKDYNMHLHILGIVTQERADICIPRWASFVTKDDTTWWASHLEKFEEGSGPCNVLCSERIPRMTKAVRNLIIDRYCPPNHRDTIRSNDADRDCLIRLYLGRRKLQNVAQEGRKPVEFSSLRNYPLHLDQAEDLSLNVVGYSRQMANILSMLHWTARVDANDVEFVLGGCQGTGQGAHINTPIGTHSLWLLDFDCCRPITMDDDGIEQAVKGFLENDPYYPRPPATPDSPDKKLWEDFRRRYLECSHRRVEKSQICQGLPEKFIRRVEEKHQQKLRQLGMFANQP